MTGLNESAAARAYIATLDDHQQTDHLLLHWRTMLFEGTAEAAEAARAKLVAHITEVHERLRPAIEARAIRPKTPAGPVSGPVLWEPLSRLTLSVSKDVARWEGPGLVFSRPASERAYYAQRQAMEAQLMATVPEGKQGRVRAHVDPTNGQSWRVALVLEVR
jgi:hypothetical protein